MTPDTFHVGDGAEILTQSNTAWVDLTVTSPPYDDLRRYKGYKFDATAMLDAIHHVTKPGGVCVWVVGDRVIKGSRSLSSFQHAFIAREIGFNIHDIMIFQKHNTPFPRSNGYTNAYEFMFIFSKGAPRVFNPLTTKTTRHGNDIVSIGDRDAGRGRKRIWRDDTKVLTNIWTYAVGGGSADKIAFKHPAIFPEKLAGDHVLSWTNPGDMVIDPMCGSGTTCKMAHVHGRRYVGIDTAAEYIAIAQQRIAAATDLLSALPVTSVSNACDSSTADE